MAPKERKSGSPTECTKVEGGAPVDYRLKASRAGEGADLAGQRTRFLSTFSGDCCRVRRILIFLLRGGPKSLQDGQKSALTGYPRRHPSGRVRSKYFKKSEKKACQPSQTPLILT